MNIRESSFNIWVDLGEAHYVYNGVSGALLRISKTQRNMLQNFLDGKEKSCTPSVLAYLAEGLMLIPADTDELSLLAQRYQSSKANQQFLSLTIVTSLGCNFNCAYCYEAKSASIMDDEVQRQVLHILDEKLPVIKSFHVTWFGGEPLIGKKPLLSLSDAFIERCDRAKVHYRAEIITNGYLLDEETCAQLRDRQIAHAQICLDGPERIHNRMRPLADGKGSFLRIMENLHHAIHYFNVTVRVNVDAKNYYYAEELFKVLAREGFARRLKISPGQIFGVYDGVPSASSTYSGRLLTNVEFAEVELQFGRLASKYGFAQQGLPMPAGAPCTAARANEIVVGSRGELYKCFESIGNHLEVVGHICDDKNLCDLEQKWLSYYPFNDPQCRSCIALPVCMGGCSHHAQNPVNYENRCCSFRYTYREQVLAFIEADRQNVLNGHVV